MQIQNASRRAFLGSVAAAAGAAPALSFFEALGLSVPLGRTASAAGLGGTAVDASSAYASLTRTEAAFTETVVNVLCPEDHLTPNGVACGLAAAIDLQLSRGTALDRQQFKQGIAAAIRTCEDRFGTRFDELSQADAARFFHMMNGGDTDGDLRFSSWMRQVVNPLLIRACFAGEIYDTYCNRVFWKVVGA
jgi:gluconate 2-dehydrogenase gamma chain